MIVTGHDRTDASHIHWSENTASLQAINATLQISGATSSVPSAPRFTKEERPLDIMFEADRTQRKKVCFR